MALIDELKVICDRLAPLGWRDLLKKVTHNSLDIKQTSAAKLKAALTKPIANVDRTLPGFEDFDGNGRQGITPGKPSQSLLYHALASPCVTRDAASAPLVELCDTEQSWRRVENAVFGLEPPTLAASGAGRREASSPSSYLRSNTDPAVDVPDRAHADLAFSRTGIARVGTARPKYLPDVDAAFGRRTRTTRTDSASFRRASRPGSRPRSLEARLASWASWRTMGRSSSGCPFTSSSTAQSVSTAWICRSAPTAKFFNMKLLKVRKLRDTQCGGAGEVSLCHHRRLGRPRAARRVRADVRQSDRPAGPRRALPLKTMAIRRPSRCRRA